MEFELFERDFIRRTQRIIDQYDRYVMTQVPPADRFDVTLLINCLLGLLVMPNERRFERIPPLSLDQLGDWGLPPDFVRAWGTHPKKVKPENRRTLAEIVYRMRNSVCHLRIEPTGDGSEITHVRFFDANGFDATLPEGVLRQFAKRLADCVGGSV